MSEALLLNQLSTFRATRFPSELSQERDYRVNLRGYKQVKLLGQEAVSGAASSPDTRPRDSPPGSVLSLYL